MVGINSVEKWHCITRVARKPDEMKEVITQVEVYEADCRYQSPFAGRRIFPASLGQ